MRPKFTRPLQNRTLESHITTAVNGVDQDVCVHFTISPAEPDVGWVGGIEIDAIYFEDEGCVMKHMTDDEIDLAADRVQDDLDSRGDPADDYADWAYDCARDDRLTGDR